MTKNADTLQDILNRSVDNKKVFGTSFAIKRGDTVWNGAAGNMTGDRQYFIASTTKLFVTVIVLNLASKGKLGLEDPISRYLDGRTMDGLHVYKGVDYSDKLTIRHLLSHTSGLPDYFEDKNAAGGSLFAELIKAGKDGSWTFEQLITRSKSLPTHFVPGTEKKAHYSDTNFQLLGAVIENLTDRPIGENYDHFIIGPLDLSATYLYQDIADSRPQPLRYKRKELHIPKAMASFGPDGGVVSTSADMLTFIESFFTGRLFPEAYVEMLQQWNRIFYPFQSGIGIHRFKLPWLLNPFGTIPELIGHSGLSGALAFHGVGKGLYIAGTVNQLAYRSTSFRLSIRLIQNMLSE